MTKRAVNRLATIGGLFSRIKKKTIIFPRVADCGSFLDEFACEVAEYDDPARTVKSSHPETLQDDAMHATNYAPWQPATAKHNGGWRCPAERLNKHRYHDNWLENLLVSGSLGGYRNRRQASGPQNP